MSRASLEGEHSNLDSYCILSRQKETDYWGITQSISYSGIEIMASAVGVVDTGTTLNYMPTDAFNAYINSTGGIFDEATGLYEITEEQYDALDDLVFTIGGVSFVACED